MDHHHYTLLADATGETIRPKKEREQRQKTKQQRHKRERTYCFCVFFFFKALWLDQALLKGTKLACLFLIKIFSFYYRNNYIIFRLID